MVKISSGIAHKIPEDLKKVLTSNKTVLSSWENISPIARNEWICWVVSSKLKETREKRIQRTKDELIEGKKRPCCWSGCIHRKDKPMSPSQKFVASKQSKK